MWLDAKTEQERDDLLWARCATDIELFSEAFFPHYCKRDFNAFHRYVFRSYVYGERDVRQSDAAPRGSAKSTIKVLIKPIHDACYALEKFILVASSTASLANQKLKDIRHEVLSNGVLSSFYGLHFKTAKPAETEFTIHSDEGVTHFAARGKGAQVRGIRIFEDRPTKIICDDIEKPEEVNSEELREKTENWYFKDVIEAGDTGTNVEIVGTILHEQSLLSKLLINPTYRGQKFKAILSWSNRRDLWDQWEKLYQNLDDTGRAITARDFYLKNEEAMTAGTAVLWPEKETYYDHMVTIQESGLASFMQERQNDPQSSSSRLFKEFHWFREEAEGLRIESSKKLVPWKELKPLGAIDPATGQAAAKQKGDFSVIATGYESLSGRLFLFHDYTKRVGPSEFISEIFNLQERFKYDDFVVETNLYRDLLMTNIADEKKRREEERRLRKADAKAIEVTFYECENRENKRARIFRLEPKVKHGHILFNKTLSHDFMQMFKDFGPGKVDHDDAPDAVEMLWGRVQGQYKPAQLGSLVAMHGR